MQDKLGLLLLSVTRPAVLDGYYVFLGTAECHPGSYSLQEFLARIQSVLGSKAPLIGTALH